jgi:hypothetical protein
VGPGIQELLTERKVSRRPAVRLTSKANRSESVIFRVVCAVKAPLELREVPLSMVSRGTVATDVFTDRVSHRLMDKEPLADRPIGGVVVRVE